LNAWDVVEFLIEWFIIWVFLTAVLLALDLYIRLRIVRSELERIIKIIEEIERLNERHEDP
jgi:hypothetical protein